jgi:hypothetical protein
VELVCAGLAHCARGNCSMSEPSAVRSFFFPAYPCGPAHAPPQSHVLLSMPCVSPPVLVVFCSQGRGECCLRRGASAHRYKRRVIAKTPPQTARLAAQSTLLHHIPIATTLAPRRERWRSLSAIARRSLCLRCSSLAVCPSAGAERCILAGLPASRLSSEQRGRSASGKRTPLPFHAASRAMAIAFGHCSPLPLPQMLIFGCLPICRR